MSAATDEGRRLAAEGWSVIYSDDGVIDDGVIARLVCAWCIDRDRRRTNRCSACKGTGVRRERRLA